MILFVSWCLAGLSILPPSFREIRLGGFRIFNILRIGYFGLAFDLAY